MVYIIYVLHLISSCIKYVRLFNYSAFVWPDAIKLLKYLNVLYENSFGIEHDLQIDCVAETWRRAGQLPISR